MSKAKPVKKPINSKAKPAKTSSSAKKEVKVEAKKPAKKPVVQIKKANAVKTHKAVAESKKEKELKKATVAAPAAKKVVEEKVTSKAQDKSSNVKTVAKVDTKAKPKTKKVEKKSEDEFDDDLIGEDFGDSEIAEYEEDLKAVEEEDDDGSLDLIEEEETVVKDEEVYLTDSEGRRLCKVRDCDQVANVEGYCRYHYLLLWKKIQTRKHILIDGKLEKYVEDLMARYPDKFLEVLKKDLKTEKDFMSVIQEMELDESAIAENDNEDEVQSYTDEIRGIGEAPSMDDDGDY